MHVWYGDKVCKPVIDGGNGMNSESHKTIDKLKVADGKHPYSYKVSVTRLCERKALEDGKPSTIAFSLSIYQIILKPAKVGSFSSRRCCTWRSQTKSSRTVPNPLIQFRPMVSDHFIKILLWLLVRYWWAILFVIRHGFASSSR